MTEWGDAQIELNRRHSFVELTIYPGCVQDLFGMTPQEVVHCYRKRYVDVSKIVTMERITHQSGDVRFGPLLEYPYTQLWFDSGYSVNVVEDVDTILGEITMKIPRRFIMVQSLDGNLLQAQEIRHARYDDAVYNEPKSIQLQADKILSMLRVTHSGGDDHTGWELMRPHTLLTLEGGFMVNVAEDVDAILDEIAGGA